MKKLLAILLAVCLLCPVLTACGDKGPAQLLSFAQGNSLEEMEKLDGKTVTIIGYMATLSPVSGKFMYLMNLPYQSCPFCVPNTNQLSNTMAVYAKDGKEFDFTDEAIRVTGTLEFGDYTDEYGYEYGYRIKDATYEVVDTSDLSPELKLWQQLAATDVVGEIYTMFDYVYFTCNWATYTMNFESGKDYLYPTDALMFIENDGYQFNYGYKEGYFEDIIATIEAVDKEAFADLVAVIREAKALSQKGYQELKAGNYTVVSEYSGSFSDGRNQYKLTAKSDLDTAWNTVFGAFSTWLNSWEL